MRYVWQHYISISKDNVHLPTATNLLPHFPQALQTAEHVAAPQQLAAKPITYTSTHQYQVLTP